VEVKIIEKPNELKNVDKLVLPGVGATNQIMNYLIQHNFLDEIKNFANSKKKIFYLQLESLADLQIMASPGSQKKKTIESFCLFGIYIKSFNFVHKIRSPALPFLEYSIVFFILN
jgi:imidazoleglycerol phosphate synthase glutamine amidotransferase subunit HisH